MKKIIKGLILSVIMGIMILSSSIVFAETTVTSLSSPNIPGIGAPVSNITILGAVNSHNQTGKGLFDGTLVDEWSADTVFYWYSSDEYLELNIPSGCNIWRSGTTSWNYDVGNLKIMKYNNGTYTDVTSQYTQTVTSIHNGTWEKTIANLPAGRYKFIGGTKYRMDSEWYVEQSSSISLNKTSDSINVGAIDTLVATTTPSGIAVNWTSSDSSIVTVDITGKVTGVKAGSATIKATTTDGSNISANCTVTVAAETDKVILNIEPEKSKIKLNETVTANLAIDNITNIAAEDIRIKYDAEKLQFIDFKEVDGIKLVKNDIKAGELRFILASKGSTNVVNAKKVLLQLNFKGIKVGEALVDIVKGRVSDGIEMEKDLTDAQCGNATIIIEDLKDVNNTGEFTLLDLAIDGRHLGETVTSLPQYNTDIVTNNAIDDADLAEIGNQMLANPNYKF